MPRNCRVLYAVQGLDVLLSASLADYTDMMADGYDDKFDIYAGAVVHVSTSRRLHRPETDTSSKAPAN
jgi:hypothetical protein